MARKKTSPKNPYEAKNPPRTPRALNYEEATRFCECGAKMKVSYETVPFTIGGLPDVSLEAMTVERCPKCKEENYLFFKQARLLRYIAGALVCKDTQLAPDEIKYLRKFLDWTRDKMGQFLATSGEAVRCWESGSAVVPHAEELLLRMHVVHRFGLRIDVDRFTRLTYVNYPNTPMKLVVNVIEAVTED